MSIRSETESRIIAMPSLPPMPEILARVWQVSDDPARSAQELADVVRLDPALSTEVLRTINGARYGLRQPVTAVREAIVLLGLKTVRNLSLTLLVRDGLLPRGRMPFKFDRVAFWRHCVSTAFAAEAIARVRRVPEPETFYLAGLLHDVGIMLLDNTSPTQLGEIEQRIRRGESAADAERRVLQYTHPEIGRFLADKWRFPIEVVGAIGAHHAPLAAPEPKIACAVYLADLMFSPNEPTSYSGGPEEHKPHAAEALQLDERALDGVYGVSMQALEGARELLAIVESPDG